MNHISILVPEGENNLSSIAGSYKILTRANEYFKQRGKTSVYNIELVGTSEKVNFHEGLFCVKPHKSIDSVRRTNLIIIPSLNHNYYSSVSRNKSIIQWIEKQYKSGAEVASICTGAFLLAATGLLNGKICSTHWSAVDDMRNEFPEIDINAEQTITYEKGIYTNGGAFSFLNLIIYLVEKYFDKATAVYCAKVFQIDMSRQSQSPFSMFSGQKNHEDDIIRRAQSYLEKNSSNKISMEQLADKLNISRRNFDRRFIKATGCTPLEYVQRLRIEVVKKRLETNAKNINEVMFEVGYTDVKSFREIFRRITGLSPLQYKQKFNRAD